MGSVLQSVGYTVTGNKKLELEICDFSELRCPLEMLFGGVTQVLSDFWRDFGGVSTSDDREPVTKPKGPCFQTTGFCKWWDQQVSKLRF